MYGSCNENTADLVSLSISQFLNDHDDEYKFDVQLQCPREDLNILYEKFPLKFEKHGTFKEMIEKIECTMLMRTGNPLDDFRAFQLYHTSYLEYCEFFNPNQHGYMLIILMLIEEPNSAYIDALSKYASSVESNLSSSKSMEGVWKAFLNDLLTRKPSDDQDFRYFVVYTLAKLAPRELVKRCLIMGSSDLIRRVIEMADGDFGWGGQVPVLTVDDFRVDPSGVEAKGSQDYNFGALPEDLLHLIFTECVHDHPIHAISILPQVSKLFYKCTSFNHDSTLCTILSMSASVCQRVVSVLHRFLVSASSQLNSRRFNKVLSLFVYSLTCHDHSWSAKSLYDAHTIRFTGFDEESLVVKWYRYTWTSVISNILAFHLHNDPVLYDKFAEKAIPISLEPVLIHNPNVKLGRTLEKILIGLLRKTIWRPRLNCPLSALQGFWLR